MALIVSLISEGGKQLWRDQYYTYLLSLISMSVFSSSAIQHSF